MLIVISGGKKKIVIGLIVILLLVAGLWIVPRATHGHDNSAPTIVRTVGEKGAPPVLERIVNRLRVYYHYR